MRKSLLCISIMLLNLLAYGQVEMEVTVDNKKAKIGQDISILVEATSDKQFQMKMPAFDPQEIEFVGYRTSRRDQIAPNGNRTTETQLLIVVRPKVAGAIKIGSFLAGQGDEIYKTEPFKLIVKNITQPQKPAIARNENKVILASQLSRSNIFLEQASVLVITAYSRNMNSLSNVRDVRVPKAQMVNYHRVKDKHREITSHKGRYSIVVAEYIIFPRKTGKIVLPPATAKLSQGGKVKVIKSHPAVLHVKPLPTDAPDNFRNAVGDFDAKLTVFANGDLEINKPVKVNLEISGVGNLKDLKLPEFKKTSEFKVYKPKVEYEVVPTKDGYKGSVTAEYVIVPEKKGEHSLSMESFAYFDPKLGQYKSTEIRSLPIAIKAADKVSSQEDTANVDNAAHFLNNKENSTVRTSIEKNKDWALGLGLVVLLGVLGFYAYSRRTKSKNEKQAIVDDLQQKQEIGSVSETEAQLRHAQQPDIEAHLTYLESLLQKENFTEIFKAFEAMDNEFHQYVNQKYNLDWSQFIEKNYGGSALDEYKNIQGQVQLLKFAPFKDRDTLKELVKSIQIYYQKFL